MMNEGTYITKQGDTWDDIAYRVYGDAAHTGWLMQHNYPLLDAFIFSADVVLHTPPVPDEANTSDAPIWRQST